MNQLVSSVTAAAVQGLCQGLVPYVHLAYAPGRAATDSLQLAAQSRPGELDLISSVQLLWTLAYLQALPGPLWGMLMGLIMDHLSPFSSLAGEFTARVVICTPRACGLADVVLA